MSTSVTASSARKGRNEGARKLEDRFRASGLKTYDHIPVAPLTFTSGLLGFTVNLEGTAHFLARTLSPRYMPSKESKRGTAPH